MVRESKSLLRLLLETKRGPRLSGNSLAFMKLFQAVAAVFNEYLALGFGKSERNDKISVVKYVHKRFTR